MPIQEFYRDGTSLIGFLQRPDGEKRSGRLVHNSPMKDGETEKDYPNSLISEVILFSDMRLVNDNEIVIEASRGINLKEGNCIWFRLDGHKKNIFCTFVNKQKGNLMYCTINGGSSALPVYEIIIEKVDKFTIKQKRLYDALINNGKKSAFKK